MSTCPQIEAAYQRGLKEAEDRATDCTIRAMWELMWQEGGPATQGFRIGFRAGAREALRQTTPGPGLSHFGIERFERACEAEIAGLRRRHEEDVARGRFFPRGAADASPRVAAAAPRL